MLSKCSAQTIRRGRWREAIERLELALPVYYRNLPTNHNNTLDAEDLLARAYEQKGDIDKATFIYRRTFPQWIQYLPRKPALEHAEIIAGFLHKHGFDDEAKAALALLQPFRETAAGTNSPTARPGPPGHPASKSSRSDQMSKPH
jgi:hypothetical protein